MVWKDLQNPSLSLGDGDTGHTLLGHLQAQPACELDAMLGPVRGARMDGDQFPSAQLLLHPVSFGYVVFLICLGMFLNFPSDFLFDPMIVQECTV